MPYSGSPNGLVSVDSGFQTGILWLLGQLSGGKSEPSRQQAAPDSRLSESGHWTAQGRLVQSACLCARPATDEWTQFPGVLPL